jgi:hypothetical protein
MRSMYGSRIAMATAETIAVIATHTVPAKTNPALGVTVFRIVNTTAYSIHGTGQSRSQPFGKSTNRVNPGRGASGILCLQKVICTPDTTQQVKQRIPKARTRSQGKDFICVC